MYLTHIPFTETCFKCCTIYLDLFQGSVNFFRANQVYFKSQINFKLVLLIGMQKTQQQLIDIADKILAQLQNDYLQTQQCNLVSHIQCPEEEVAHQDYHILGGDDDEPDQMSDDEEQGEEGEKNQIKNQSVVESSELQEEDKKVGQSLEQSKANQEIGELFQVFPTGEWKASQKQININSQKIKQLTLNMNLPVPQWMKDEDMLKKRITQLFGQKNTK